MEKIVSGINSILMNSPAWLTFIVLYLLTVGVLRLWRKAKPLKIISPLYRYGPVFVLVIVTCGLYLRQEFNIPIRFFEIGILFWTMVPSIAAYVISLRISKDGGEFASPWFYFFVSPFLLWLLLINATTILRFGEGTPYFLCSISLLGIGYLMYSYFDAGIHKLRIDPKNGEVITIEE